MSLIKILALGDVVGAPGREYVREKLWKFRRENSIDAVILNAENSADGNGVNPESAKFLLEQGADILTTGNHIFKKSTIYSFLDNSSEIVRPANFPDTCPGNGYTIRNISGWRVLVMNVLGVIFMTSLRSPFDTIDAILAREAGNYDLSILDIHAEATSEKLALAHYFDGRVNIIFGTHTHVQTSDARILPGGSGYITDLGMTGPVDSILGVKKSKIIEHLKSSMPTLFEVADGECAANGALFSFDTDKKCIIETKAVIF